VLQRRMTESISRALHRLRQQLPGRISTPGDDRYAAAMAIWAKPVGSMPRGVVHCLTAEDVQSAIRVVRDCQVPLSVRGGGHDWAGRALCGGIVIDLSGMNGVIVGSDSSTAQISGGARASDVLAVTDPLCLAAVTGTCSGVGMAGLTLGGGYGPLIGRFGLALDNLLAAEVVLADGRIVTADPNSEEDLFWALRGGGGNFGVVTAMQYCLHDLPSVRSGMLLFPFAEAEAVLSRCASITASAPDELTVQLGLVAGPAGAPVVMIVPTWCGLPAEGEARLAPFFELGTLLVATVDVMPFGSSLAVFDQHIVNGRRVLMETSWIPAVDRSCIGAFIEAMATAVSPGCAIMTHEFRGAASRIAEEATAFGLRRDHVMVEILASFDERLDPLVEWKHHQWVQTTLRALSAMALPGGYPNLLPAGTSQRATKSYGRNAARLIDVKRHYDPSSVFCSAIPLPTS
jgi:hypothetical protein